MYYLSGLNTNTVVPVTRFNCIENIGDTNGKVYRVH